MNLNKHLIFYLATFSILLKCISVSAQDTIIISDQDLQNQMYRWNPDTVYLLRGEVILEGGSLEIEAGTEILAIADSVGTSLTIGQDAQLIIKGTPVAPVLFSTLDSKINWLGIRIYGQPSVSSGTLQYLSIVNAGSPDHNREGVALLLNQVDENTVLNHIEVYHSIGDGIRIVGGNVNLSYPAVSYVADDAFEWDHGWTGNGIYWFVNTVGTSTAAPPNASYAIEGNSYISEQDTLISDPKIYHATIIGENCGTTAKVGKAAIGILNGSKGEIANSIISNFSAYGIYIQDLPGDHESYTNLKNGSLNIKNNLWWDFGRSSVSMAGNQLKADVNGMICTDISGEDPQADFLIEHFMTNQNFIAGPILRKNHVGTCIALDPRIDFRFEYPESPNLALPDNPFFANFENALEKGAFSDSIWLNNWTVLSQNAILGEDGHGSFTFKGNKLELIDTIIIDCSELPSLQDSLFYIFPCRARPYQLGATYRKGNARRARPRSREDIDAAFIEEWEYIAGLGCDPVDEMYLTILVIDTTAPILHPVPEKTGGLSVVLEDCDLAWVTETMIDTLQSESELTLEYTFKATDYSGNTSSLSIQLKVDSMSEMTWYADLDGDGFGNPNLSIESSDSIPGFVSNGDDCNDSDETAFPGSQTSGFFSAVDFACESASNYDICSNARDITVGSIWNEDTISLSYANPSIYPSLDESCIPANFDDVWLRFEMPASGEVTINFREYSEYIFDLDGFNRAYSLEFYGGDCHDMTWLNCTQSSGSKLYTDFKDSTRTGEMIYIRVTESGNKSNSPFVISILESKDVIHNSFCISATPLEVQPVEFCTPDTFSLMNAIPSEEFFNSNCFFSFQDNDAWFSFLSPESDSFQLNLERPADSDFEDPVVLLYTGQCGNLQEVACLEIENGFNSFNTWISSKPDIQHFVRVLDKQNHQGPFIISICTNDPSTSVTNFHDPESFSIYPNPLMGSSFRLNSNHTIEGPWIINIRNIQGQLVQQISRSYPLKTSEILTLEIGIHNTGIYLVELISGKNRSIKKLIISQ